MHNFTLIAEEFLKNLVNLKSLFFLFDKWKKHFFTIFESRQPLSSLEFLTHESVLIWFDKEFRRGATKKTAEPSGRQLQHSLRNFFLTMYGRKIHPMSMANVLKYVESSEFWWLNEWGLGASAISNFSKFIKSHSLRTLTRFFSYYLNNGIVNFDSGSRKNVS